MPHPRPTVFPHISSIYPRRSEKREYYQEINIYLKAVLTVLGILKSTSFGDPALHPAEEHVDFIYKESEIKSSIKFVSFDNIKKIIFDIKCTFV